MSNPLPHPLDAPDDERPLLPGRLLPTSLPALQRMAVGVGLIWTSVVIAIISAIASLVLGFLAPRNPALLGPARLTICITLGAGLMNLVGTIVCLAAPAEIGGAVYLYSSLAYMLVAGGILSANYFQVHIPALLFSMAGPAFVLATIFFVLFLRELATALDVSRLAQRTVVVLIGFVALFVTLLAQIVASELMFRQIMQAGGPFNAAGSWMQSGWGIALIILDIVLAVTALCVSIMYARLLYGVRIELRRFRKGVAVVENSAQ